jgi:hypothetical protein
MVERRINDLRLLVNAEKEFFSSLLEAYIESKGVLTLTPTTYGFGTSDALNPDGTQARRMQGSARSVF